MATKKAGSTAKKTSKKPSVATKPSTTAKSNVTTVKAVEATTPAKKVSRMPRFGTFGGERSSYLLGALVAEFVGTFILASVVMITNGEPLYIGFTLVAIVLAVGTLSGAHVNPLVTVGAWVTRKMTALRALGYIAAQVLGAALALTVLSVFVGAAPAQNPSDAMFGQAATVSLFQVAPLTESAHWYVFFAELLGATLFAFAVSSARRDGVDRVAKAFGIGFGLFVAALIASVAAKNAGANAILNPAIAFFVGAVSDWSNINWFAFAAYGVAPLIGGVLGFALQDALHAAQNKKDV